MKKLATATALILIMSSSVGAQANYTNAAPAIMSNNTTSTAPPLDQYNYDDRGRDTYNYDDRGRDTKATVTTLAMNQPVEPAAIPSAGKYAGGEAKSVAAPPSYPGSGSGKTNRIGPNNAILRNISPNEFNWMQGGGG